MRPDIADLVVGSIYEELLNHDSVKTYPDVMGVTKNVFFITHNEQESSVRLKFNILQKLLRIITLSIFLIVNCTSFLDTSRIAIR